MVQPVPEGFHTLNPLLCCHDPSAAIAFYQQAFGAEEVLVMHMPDGVTVMHAELRFGDSMMMLTGEWPEMAQSPRQLGGTPVTMALYVPDCDAAHRRAVEAGATSLMEPADMFWGDRYGKVRDPFGHEWGISTHIEDVSPEECAKRAAEAFGSGGAAEGQG